MANKTFQRNLLLLCTIVLSSCTVQTPVPLPTATKVPLPTATNLPSPTPKPTTTPLPATWLNIGIEGSSIQPNVLTYLFNDHPAFSDSLFQAVIHPGLFKLNPDDENLNPVIANSPVDEWIKKDEYLEQTVEIKPGMKWSDGTIFTTDDILYSFNLVRNLASLHLGSNREILFNSSIEVGSTGQIIIKITGDIASPGITKSLLTFPILQKKYWEKYTIQLFENQSSEQLKRIASDLDQLAAMRIQQDQVWNILLQHLKDTRIQINNKQSKVSDLKVFLSGRKTPHNLNGVQDGEDLVDTNNKITILLGEISALQGILDGLVIQLDGMRSQMIASIQQQVELEDTLYGLMEETIQSIPDLDLGAEPLAIPYSIKTNSQSFVEIYALTDQVSSPNNIAFQAMSSDDLVSNFEQGNLDTIFSITNTDIAVEKSLEGTARVSAVIFNPISDKLVNPVLGQAIACIYSSPDLWEGSSFTGSISLQAYEAPPGPTLDLPGCSGSYKTRLLYMRMMLDKNLFTWNYLRNGSIIPGSIKDPLGQAISPLILAVDPNSQLPDDVREKLTLSLNKLGIDIIISQLPNPSDINADRSVDMVLAQWNTSLAVNDQLCSLPAYSGYSRYPVHMQSALLESCGVTSVTLPTDPQPTPTPTILLTGKEASASYIPQSWVVVLTRDYLSYYWNFISINKYDLTWLLPLTPSWVTSW
jgi:hypothetical protein